MVSHMMRRIGGGVSFEVEVRSAALKDGIVYDSIRKRLKSEVSGYNWV